jgi:lipid II:glycine glycyltransferase (peptidoglycan interpeptide bridge formation enzyme)
MISVEKTSPDACEDLAGKAGVMLPIEQSALWARFQHDIPGRESWGGLVIRQDGEAVATLSLIDMQTHGYHYLRSTHGPVWFEGKPSEELEREAIAAVADCVRANDRHAAFVRLDVWYGDRYETVLSTVPYNQTVILDLTGGDDEILKRMKRRGRRDVRKALRECPATIADETDQALKDFTQYYDVMVETGERDGFAPAPSSDYSDMITTLGPEHCRVFAARIDGHVAAWSIVTVNGTHAVRYYAAMRSEVMQLLVTDRLLYSECCILGSQGITQYDLMGIGSDFAPSLNGLNTFKTKFSEEITPVAAGHDVPLKKTFYRSLKLAKSIKNRIRK